MNATPIRLIIAFALFALSANIFAQTPPPVSEGAGVGPIVGYFSYNSIFQIMPEYVEAQKNYETLKAKYDAEAARAEAEFQRKFSEFLQGQKDFPTSIMRKRQTELQELMETSINFRQQAQKLLADAERELQQPVRNRLDQAISAVAMRRGFVVVINTDAGATPFLNPDASVNIHTDILRELGLASPPPSPTE